MVKAAATTRLVADVSVRFRTIHGYRRAYRMAGSGPVVLLLHGIGDSSASWAPLFPALARDYTVLAPDLLGHGDSAKPRADYSVAAYANGMRDLAAVLGIERMTVVGHSLGGGVAAQLAYQYPELVERLVLVATGGIARDVSPILRAASLPGSDSLMARLQEFPARYITRMGIEAMRWLGTDLGRDADDIIRVMGLLPDAPTRSAFSRTLRSVVDWRGQLVTMLDRMYLVDRLPVMVVWGERDPIIPVAHAHLAAQQLKGLQLELYPEAGHFPHHQDPVRFVTDLHHFIESTAPFEYDRERTRRLLRKGAPGRVEPVTEVAEIEQRSERRSERRSSDRSS